MEEAAPASGGSPSAGPSGPSMGSSGRLAGQVYSCRRKSGSPSPWPSSAPGRLAQQGPWVPCGTHRPTQLDSSMLRTARGHSRGRERLPGQRSGNWTKGRKYKESRPLPGPQRTQDTAQHQDRSLVSFPNGLSFKGHFWGISLGPRQMAATKIC